MMNSDDTMQTALAHEFWAGPRALTWIEEYWATLNSPYRHALLGALAELPPFRTLLEIGCHAGMNLRLIHEAYPEVQLWGIDINERAITEGRALLQSAGVPATLEIRTLPADTQIWADQMFDVVLTCYTLAYLSPSDIVAALSECWRLTAKHLVMLEPMALPPDFQRQELMGHTEGEERIDFVEWRHDYIQALCAIPECANTTADLSMFEFPDELRRDDLSDEMVSMSNRLNGLLVLHRC